MKNHKTFFWIATVILILWEGVMPLATLLFAPEYATVGTAALGYPDYFAYTLIVCKVLGVIAISVPGIPERVREWAYAGLAFNLIYAFISHACVDGDISYMLMPLVFLGILIISYTFKPQGNQKSL
jgi:hypothetical protein